MSPTSVLRVISAGAIPVLEYVGNPDGCRNFSVAALKNKPSDYSAVDLSLRLACNELINGAKKRSIVMISNGEDKLVVKRETYEDLIRNDIL